MVARFGNSVAGVAPVFTLVILGVSAAGRAAHISADPTVHDVLMEQWKDVGEKIIAMAARTASRSSAASSSRL